MNSANHCSSQSPPFFAQEVPHEITKKESDTTLKSHLPDCNPALASPEEARIRSITPPAGIRANVFHALLLKDTSPGSTLNFRAGTPEGKASRLSPSISPLVPYQISRKGKDPFTSDQIIDDSETGKDEL